MPTENQASQQNKQQACELPFCLGARCGRSREHFRDQGGSPSGRDRSERIRNEVVDPRNEMQETHARSDSIEREPAQRALHTHAANRADPQL